MVDARIAKMEIFGENAKYDELDNNKYASIHPK